MIRKIKGSKTLRRIHAYNYQFYLKYYNNWEAFRRDLEESNKHHDELFPNVRTISSREEVLQLEREGKW
jgi:hypothetical protein